MPHPAWKALLPDARTWSAFINGVVFLPVYLIILIVGSALLELGWTYNLLKAFAQPARLVLGLFRPLPDPAALTQNEFFQLYLGVPDEMTGITLSALAWAVIGYGIWLLFMRLIPFLLARTRR
jgi:hypothetical protein